MTPINGQVVYNRINQIREERGIDSLAVDPILVKASQAKAKDMANRGYFSHRSPEGKNMWFFAGSCKCSVLGENLAKKYSTVEALESAWMRSKTHRENLLDASWKKTGIGIATANDGTIYVVQYFSK